MLVGSPQPLSEAYLTAELAVSPGKTFLVCMPDSSMTAQLIYEGDWLVVDRTLQPTTKSVVIASMDSEPEVVLFSRICGPRLLPLTWIIWGVVTHSIHRL